MVRFDFTAEDLLGAFLVEIDDGREAVSVDELGNAVDRDFAFEVVPEFIKLLQQ